MRTRLLVLLVVALSAVDWPAAAEEKLGRLIVKVTEAGTGKPVVGARVDPNTGSPDPLNEDARLTDASGRVEIPVPLGNLRINSPLPPPGHWIVKKWFGQMPTEQVELTRQQPVIERSFATLPGVLWPAKVVTRLGKPAEGVRLLVAANRFREGANGGVAVTDAAGIANITLPRAGGSLYVSCSHRKLPIGFTSSRVQLEVAPDFDHTQVASVGPAAMGDRILFVDRQGRQASCAGCTAVLRDGIAQLQFEVNDPPGDEFLGQVAGRVVDEAGQPVPGVTVMCQCDAMTVDEYLKQTNERGEYQFRGYFKWSPPGRQPGFGLQLNKDGYGRQEIGHFYTPGTDGVFRLEPLVLKRVYSAAIRVLDVDGEPVEGAWVASAVGDYYGYKSNRDGYCTLRNLPVGTVAVGVSFGDQTGSAKIEVTPGAVGAEAVVVKLHKRSVDLNASATRAPAVRLQLGQPAPEWNIEQWTDGKQHTLADLRGRIVVIEFWDFGCSPCREISLPVSNILQAKFKDVAFVHINPAGSQPHLIKELLALNRWNFVVGFDKGTSSRDSETLQRYGVTGFSTIMILDRRGRILMNSSLPGDKAQEDAQMKAAAAELGLPWPIDKDASQAEIIRRMRRIHEHWMTKEIEAALATK